MTAHDTYEQANAANWGGWNPPENVMTEEEAREEFLEDLHEERMAIEDGDLEHEKSLIAEFIDEAGEYYTLDFCKGFIELFYLDDNFSVAKFMMAAFRHYEEVNEVNSEYLIDRVYLLLDVSELVASGIQEKSQEFDEIVRNLTDIVSNMLYKDCCVRLRRK